MKNANASTAINLVHSNLGPVTQAKAGRGPRGDGDGEGERGDREEGEREREERERAGGDRLCQNQYQSDSEKGVDIWTKIGE